jgi:hypothetical protein
LQEKFAFLKSKRIPVVSQSLASEGLLNKKPGPKIYVAMSFLLSHRPVAPPCSLEQSLSDFSGSGADFMTFSRSTDFMEVLATFTEIMKKVDIEPGPINVFFPKIRFYLRSEVPRYIIKYFRFCWLGKTCCLQYKVTNVVNL